VKWITGSLVGLTLILAILYATVGGTFLLIGLSTVGLTVLISGIFSVGIWYAHRSIQLGAKLAIEAQNNNDRWDTVKMQSLAQYGKEILKLKGDNQATNGYPLLEQDNDTFDVDFTIQGVDNE
jgi:hypothetical protein